MNCPNCGSPQSRVTDSRAREDTKSIRRRRECLKCGERWTTREVIITEFKVAMSKEAAIAALNDIQNVLMGYAVEKPQTD